MGKGCVKGLQFYLTENEGGRVGLGLKQDTASGLYLGLVVWFIPLDKWVNVCGSAEVELLPDKEEGPFVIAPVKVLKRNGVDVPEWDYLFGETSTGEEKLVLMDLDWVPTEGTCVECESCEGDLAAVLWIHEWICSYRWAEAQRGTSDKAAGEV